MRIFLFNCFLLLGFVVAPVPKILVDLSESAAIMSQNLPPNTCRYVRINSILEARCFQLDSYKIPLDLNPDIQVLNITGSIMDLSNDSLHPYKKLAFIYLSNNWIHKIGEAAFANQPYLEVLDLSHNYYLNPPTSIFQLPLLHALYLGNNKYIDSMFKKVTSPLRLLELSKNCLTVIPNIGVQPTLLNLNVSNNKITTISTEDLARFCSLKELDLTKNNIEFAAGSCDCQRFNAWVKLRQIKMKPDLYNCTNSLTALSEDCVNVAFSNRTFELFNECLAMIQQEMETEKSRSVWIYVVPCVSVFLFMVFVALFCVHKRYRRRRMKPEEQLTAIYNNTELNTELLQQQSDDN